MDALRYYIARGNLLNSKNQIQIFVDVHLLSEVLQGKLKIIFYIKNVLDLKPRFEVFV